MSKARLNVDITEEQLEILRKYLGYGYRKQVLGKIIEQLVRMLDRRGSDVAGDILAGRVCLGPAQGEEASITKIVNHFGMSNNVSAALSKIWQSEPSLSDLSEAANFLDAEAQEKHEEN